MQTSWSPEIATKTVQDVTIQDHAHVHLGDVYHLSHDGRQDETSRFGLCWGSAPLIDADSFIGRAEDLEHMKQILQPGVPTAEQRRLVLGGIGGIGKTQLMLAYARRHHGSYTSVLWLNATTELTLKASFRSFGQNVIKVEVLEANTDDQVVRHVQRWLCNMANTTWLLLFDNYDNPDQFEIEKYCPNIGHGSVIITSRLPERVQGHQMRLSPLQSISECLDILRTRSRRTIGSDDRAANALVDRLDGLPLALATAGAYLIRGSITLSQYLHAYEQRWKVDPRRPPRLPGYNDRTLYTTWDLTFSRLKIDDPEAAQLLRLTAYFNNQGVSYQLLRAGMESDIPLWLQALLSDVFSFESAMSTLMEYCLIEKKDDHGLYNIHNCVHDWIFNSLNQEIDWQLYRYAFRCVSACIDEEDWSLSRLDHARYNRLASHARQLTHDRFQKHNLFVGTDLRSADQAIRIAGLLSNQTLWASATWLYEQILAHCETVFGSEDESTLATLVNLASLYHTQGRLDEAFVLYKKAILGFQKPACVIHPANLTAIENFATMCAERGELTKAQVLFKRVLIGYESTFGPHHISTLTSMNNLGLCYIDQGLFNDAEMLLTRALESQKDAHICDAATTLLTFHNLGKLYSKQRRYREAKIMFNQAIDGYEQLLGPDHESTLEVTKNLGVLYVSENRLEDAEKAYLRALAGKERLYGFDNNSILILLCKLGSLYIRQNKANEAEKMYLRALSGFERACGFGNPVTLDVLHNLRLVYMAQGNVAQAEQVILRILDAGLISLPLEDASTLHLLYNIGCRYVEQNDLAEAEGTFSRILTFYQSDRFEPLWTYTILDLAKVLGDSVRLAGHTRTALRPMGRLIRHVDKWRSKVDTDSILFRLIKPLVCVMDDSNAELAMLHQMKAQNLKPPELSGALCDGCDANLTLKLGRHICRRCEGVDMCNDCMSAYKNKTKKLPTCDAHEFFDAGSAVSTLLKDPEFVEKHDIQEWIDDMKRQYPVDVGDDCGLTYNHTGNDRPQQRKSSHGVQLGIDLTRFPVGEHPMSIQV